MLGSLRPSAFFGQAFGEIDAELSGPRPGPGGGIRVSVGLSLAAVILTGLEYWANLPTYRLVCRAVTDRAELCAGPFSELYSFVWWSALHVLGYFVVPILVATYVLRMSWLEQGLAVSGSRQKWRLYGLLWLIVSPLIVAASFVRDFASYYPFYSQASRSVFDLLCWELLYIAQFFALEYFFRGFLLNLCRPVMGSVAISVMIVPYCMIHFGKPMLEALGAIVAGFVLGTLAMRTRSIWGGFAVHVGVALTMDMAALLRGTGLPSRLWP